MVEVTSHLSVVRDRAKLLQQAQPIKQPAELRDLAGSEAVEHETGHCDLPSGREDPQKLALVGASPCPALGDAVLFGDQLFLGGIPVGERAAQGHSERFEALLAHLSSSRENDGCVGSHQFICCCCVPLIPKLFNKTAYQRLVLFDCHGRFSFVCLLLFTGGNGSTARSILAVVHRDN